MSNIHKVFILISTKYLYTFSYTEYMLYSNTIYKLDRFIVSSDTINKLDCFNVSSNTIYKFDCFNVLSNIINNLESRIYKS